MCLVIEDCNEAFIAWHSNASLKPQMLHRSGSGLVIPRAFLWET